MLNKEEIKSVVEQHFEGTDKFLVRINITSANVVDVYVDGDHGISINECVALSRFIVSNFDRDIEDYELRVSSPGIDQPFRMLRQYAKYINKPVIVVPLEDKKIKGLLISFNEEFVEIEIAGTKKEPVRREKILFENIKEVKPDIVF